MNRIPQVGEKITVMTKAQSFAPVFLPLFNRWTEKGPDSYFYTGVVVRADPWMNNDEFKLQTDSGVRIIHLQNVLAINQKPYQYQPPQKDEVKIIKIKSSKGNSTYDVEVRNGIAETCTCPGFAYHQGRCKHLAMAIQGANK